MNFLSSRINIIFLFLLFGCDSRKHPAIEQSEPAVRIASVAHSQQCHPLEFVGRTEACLAADLEFEIEGLIEQVLVDAGDVVEAGKQIAKIQDQDYQLAVQSATAELETAKSQLSLLLEGTRSEDIEFAKSEYEAIRETTEYHKSELKRAEALLKSNAATSQAERDLQKMLHVSNSKKLQAAKSRLDRAIAGPRQQEIAAAKEQVRLREAARNIAQRNLDKTTLRAPFRGTIQQRLVDEGNLSHNFPTGPVTVVRIANIEKLDAVFAIPERWHGRFKTGQMVEVRLASRHEVQTKARVFSVGQIADAKTGTVKLRARIDNADQNFLANSVVILNHQIHDRSSLSIPLTALRKPYNAPPYVYVVTEDDRVEHRQVEVRVRRSRCEVLSGIFENERVIVGGGHRVLPGEKVKPIESDAIHSGATMP